VRASPANTSSSAREKRRTPPPPSGSARCGTSKAGCLKGA
jgi:hypothetical protein